jgi:hypothetical protein
VTYRTLFDIAGQSYSPGFLIVALAAAVLAALFFRLKRQASILALSGMVLMLIAAAGSFWTLRADQQAYREGRYETVEGPVADFVPYRAHHPESFSVNGVSFSYYPAKISASASGVFDPAWRSGLSGGAPVRIAYHGKKIFKLEIAG